MLVAMWRDERTWPLCGTPDAGIAVRREHSAYTRTFLSFLLLILTGLTACSALKSQSPEQRYFETRDSFIRKLENATKPVEVSPDLGELEKQLRTIVGPVRIEGFPGQGRIDLPTLQSEFAPGQVDGLRFDSRSESLFVTTEQLLRHYLSERPELPQSLEAISKSGDFYRRVFHWDAGVVYYADVPVKSRAGQAFVHVFLGVSAQDIAPFIPNEIFVFVSTGKQIRLANAPATVEISDIPQCRREWGTFNRKASDALAMYRSSHLKNRKAIEDHFRYEAQGFEAYQRCFGREAKSQPFFAALEVQAQSIVDRMLKH